MMVKYPGGTIIGILDAIFQFYASTWLKTYLILEDLAEPSSEPVPDRIHRWLEHKQSELNFVSVIVSLPQSCSE